MTNRVTRRTFVASTAGFGASMLTTASVARLAAAPQSMEKIVIGVMGTSRGQTGIGRGTELARELARLPGAEIAFVCDVDRRARDNAATEVEKLQKKRPKAVSDFRRVLDDPAVDALVIAAPDHWHAPATILACQAGKHVYVEKPCSHNPREGELMVEAARRHNRVVQLGTQRRSWPGVQEAIERVRAGEIGVPKLARCWYFNSRPSIGHGSQTEIPEWLDYALWQGPAPEKPYQDNVVHYNWHWFWHWGTGELGNNGVHFVDVCRWGLGVDYPQRVASIGGKYAHDDDNETPDTNVVTFDFGDRAITWECRNWSRHTKLDPEYDIAFSGDKGTLAISGSRYVILDREGNEIDQGSGPGGDTGHLQNFLEAIRGSAQLNAEIEEGHKTTLLCHLGNISWRTGRQLGTDPANGRIKNDAEAERLWSREYRAGWEPRV